MESIILIMANKSLEEEIKITKEMRRRFKDAKKYWETVLKEFPDDKGDLLPGLSPEYGSGQRLHIRIPEYKD